ncbi:MAG: hypothetical protein ABIS50_16710 [Luteolibacter sp.]|uniref:hypothetical protein n=1 Tax=Luteolibacter sp. TaxID=1962973 RepID=UPI003264D4C7
MLSHRTINYASPPPGSFWVWSPEYDAVEWYDGSTLAMWQELHGVLKFLGDDSGLPPLGAVLLLLAACRDEWLGLCIPFHEKVMSILDVANSDSISPEIKDLIVRGLKSVNDLPKDLRASFPAKCLLVSALFEGGPHSLPREESDKILAELSIHGPRGLLGSSPQMNAKARFLRDLRALRIGLARHDAGSLEARLRTGLENSTILPTSFPETPADDPLLLLDRLAITGGECGAAAAVAKRTIAMMNLPGSFGTPHDLPVGGISDITNRGTVDRLLPGELAWDDLVLAARLVHNEALYFRREIPPQHLVVGHTILLDRGLRLWGTGRVFALGVALGLRHHPALSRTGETFDCVAALIGGFASLDLATPAGVYSALEELIPAPGPDAFLTAWHDASLAADDDAVPDVTFITAEAHLGDASTRRLLGEIATWIHGKAGQFRVIALGRTGEVEVQMWSPGGNRTLFRGEVDLDEIFPKPPESPKQPIAPPLRAKPDPLHALLYIYTLDRLPFLFPEIPQGSAILSENDLPDSPVIGVSSGRRLMQWPRTGWGGQELVAKVPGRQHWMGFNEQREVIIIASGRKPGDVVRVFRVEQDRLLEITIAASQHAFPRLATVSGGAVLLAYSDSVEALSLGSGKRVAVLSVKTWSGNRVIDFDGEQIRLIDPGTEPGLPLKGWPFGEASWPHFIVPDGVAIVSGLLAVRCGEKFYEFNPVDVEWNEAPILSKIPFASFEKSDFSPAPDIRLEVARLSLWIEVWHDPRGMLHLRQPAKPESSWSILLSTVATSAWHADWGLCSMEPRLRLPDAGKPDDRQLWLLRHFLNEQPASP